MERTKENYHEATQKLSEKSRKILDDDERENSRFGRQNLKNFG